MLKRCAKYLKSSKCPIECRQKYSFCRGSELHRMSIMSSELNDATEVAIIDFVKCTFCRQFVQPPSLCCDEGHFICTPCRAKVTKCPTCGSTTFPNRVNSVFDHILRIMFYPCVYEENGCQGFFKYSEINEHQSQCSYEKVACCFKSEGCPEMTTLREKKSHEENCPYGVPCRLFTKVTGKIKQMCKWRGRKEELFTHVSTHAHINTWLPHTTLKTNVTFTWLLIMEMDYEKTEFMRMDDTGEMFYFHVKGLCRGPQYIGVQHIGDDEVAATYMYEVTFKYSNKHIIFRDKVIPSSEADVFNNSACCNFHYKFLNYHFQAERVCDCYIRVFRQGQESVKGTKILHFLGSEVTEERDGRVSNRESFRNVIENSLEAMPGSESFA